MVDALKFDRKQIGDLMHPSTVKPVLFACFLYESGRRGKLHPSFDDHGRSLTKPLGFGIVKANGDDVWKGLAGGLGFSPSSQENASRAGANAPNPCLAVGGPLGKDEDVTARGESRSEGRQTLLISEPGALCVPHILRSFDRHDARQFEQTPQQRDVKERVLGNGGQLPGKDRGHQHRVDEPAGVPGDVEASAIRRKVFIVDDVHLSKPNVGQETIEPPNQSVGEREPR